MSIVSDAKEFASSVYTTSLDAFQMALMLTTALAWNSCVKALIEGSNLYNKERKGWGLLIYAIVMTIITVTVVMISRRWLGYKGQTRPIVYSVIPPAM